MNRSEASDLLYVIRKWWHMSTAVNPDDVAAAMLLLEPVDFDDARAAIVRLRENDPDRRNDYPPSIPAIVTEATRRRPSPLPPPPALEPPPVTDDDLVAGIIAEARADLERIAARRGGARFRGRKPAPAPPAVGRPPLPVAASLNDPSLARPSPSEKEARP